MSQQEKGKILLVDDEPLVLELTEEMLASDGYTVLTAASAHRAIELLRSEEISALVCDVCLGESNGFVVAEKARHLYPEIPVVLITGRPNTEGSELAGEQSYGYLSKPYSMPQLLSSVKFARKFESESFQHSKSVAA